VDSVGYQGECCAVAVFPGGRPARLDASHERAWLGGMADGSLIRPAPTVPCHDERMGLPADQLSPGEVVVLDLHEHWKRLIGAIGICMTALAGLVVLLAIGPEDGFFAWLDTLGWIAFAGVVLVFGVWPALAWWRRTYTLTNERWATRTGVLRRSGRDIPLTRINDVAFEQGLFDRLVGAGTLKVSAASEEGTAVLKDIPDIHGVTLRMNELVRQVRDGGRSSS
jgi:membrane protein YdbS with pleckstrin-like domain